jgi:glycosyltransferase involved in cell wall biosynthesis
MIDAIRRRRSPALLVLIPIYNDWQAASLLLRRLDKVLAQCGLSPDVLLVDDGSTMRPSATISNHNFVAIERIEVLALRRNLGHQRAIAIGLAYVQDHIKPGAVLVMDGDGEDAPEDVPRLVSRLSVERGQKVIFAERTKRSESLAFRVCYNLYRLSHLLLTGIPVRVGNFSIIPKLQLERLVVVSELWNHYAASVFKARLPRETIPTVRARRLSGQSHMNFVALVGHGLSALSVHAELIGVRLLVMTGIAIIFISVLLAAVFGVHLSTSLVIPGWAMTVVELLLAILVQAIAFTILFVFVILHGRSQPLFIPMRDYAFFVIKGATALFPPVSGDLSLEVFASR